MSSWQLHAVEVQEGQLLMNQAERDRLVTPGKARKLISQRAAAEELGVTFRDAIPQNRGVL
jgi:hypothetical protein